MIRWDASVRLGHYGSPYGKMILLTNVHCMRFPKWFFIKFPFSHTQPQMPDASCPESLQLYRQGIGGKTIKVNSTYVIVMFEWTWCYVYFCVSVCYPELKANELLRVRDEVIKEITAVDDELGAKEDAFKVLFFYNFTFWEGPWRRQRKWEWPRVSVSSPHYVRPPSQR